MLLCLPMVAQQLTGIVTDAETGDSIPFASIVYKGHHVAAVSSLSGRYSIARHEGWNLTFSAVGYQPRIVPVNEKTRSKLNIELKPDRRQLAEVTVKASKRRYSRKDNPAVELMKKVISAKKRTDLARHDFYQYNKYEKLTLAVNDLTPQQLENKPFAKAPWLVEQVESCIYNQKLILPISVDETVSQKIYRRHPHDEKVIIRGQQSTGVNDLFQTGDILTIAMKDVFTDVDLYDDQIRLLQYPFTSPIGKDAISFYRYYIEDTLAIGRDSCIHIHFLPNNQQDFGFRGDLYILKDSSYHVRRCELTIPKRSDVNFVENLRIEQEYTRLDNGEWVLTQDDMITEMRFAKFLQKVIVIRTTRMSEYDFGELPRSLFRSKRKEIKEADAEMRDEAFWQRYRQVGLTKSENSMDAFINHIRNIKGFKYFIFAAKALIENFVETSSPSKIDLGPMNTTITSNFIDGLRTRISVQSTANLDPHLFLKGYYARGWESHKNYYNPELIYSLTTQDYLPREFPKRTLSIKSTYDVCSPSDKFIHTDKDNVFTAFKWARIDKMMFYNRQEIGFEYEQDWGFRTMLTLKTEENEACGSLGFVPLDKAQLAVNSDGIQVLDASSMQNAANSRRIRTTELHAELRFAPGETYINTKQRRLTINFDAPVFTIGHTAGFKGLLGGDYEYQYTEASVYKRFWMKSWGKVDLRLKAGAQWGKVPFPLLIMPAANQSYIIEDETFNLINNMEFVNDRFASMMLTWDMNGKIFNRIPLVRHLKWREFFGIYMLWGKLTDKNNPLLEMNAGDATLMALPNGCHVMDSKKPYAELVLGIHNIFKLIHVEYVRRLNYLDLSSSEKNGIRFTFRMTF